MNIKNSPNYELSHESIIKLLKTEKLGLGDLIELLSTDVIAKIKKDSINEGFWSFSKVMESLQSHFIKANISHFEKESEATYQYNLAYVLPEIFVQTKYYNSSFYLKLEYLQFIAVLSRGEHINYIIQLLESDCGWYEQPRKLLNIMFQVTSRRIFSPDQEKIFLNSIEEKIKNYATVPPRELDIVLTSISSRKSSISESRSDIDLSMNADSRICLFISGQLRGYERALPTIVSSFSNLSNVDVFVSTWDNIGWGTISPERLSRFFTEDAYNYLLSKYASEESIPILNSLLANNPLIDKVDPTKIIEKYFSTAASLSMNSLDDTVYPFNRMNVSEKMYFHNSYWIETLGAAHFNKYDLMVKIRPDLALMNSDIKFDQLKISDDAIYVENFGGWIYRDWGFGIGDQMIYGTVKNTLKVLLSHGENRDSTVLVKFLSNLENGYSGHRNCGINAWLNGLDCKGSTIKPTEICSLDKFSLHDINKFEENNMKIGSS